MDFRLLGSLEVWDGDRQLELGGSKRRAVLALLLLHANEVVAVDRLVDQLWGDKAPRNAAAAVRTHVSRLRKELGPDVVATQAWGYVLRTEPGAVDLERFERLTAEAENLPANERAAKLREALALWRGPPLEDLAFEPGIARHTARLEELHLTVLENRIDADLEAANHAGLVSELEGLIAEHPLRERLRGQLILTLYRSGRQAEALEVYRETRRVLADELGLEPSPELRELERAILQHDPALRVAPSAAAVAVETGVRPGRRRRVFIGASLALLLAGLGAATAYALSRHPTHFAAVLQSTSATNVKQTNTTASTGSVQQGDAVTVRTAAATTTVKQTRQGTSTNPHSATTRPPKTTPKQPKSVRPPKPKTAAIPKPVTITDSFSGSTLDPLTWTSGSGGTGASFALTNGQLVFTIAGNATLDPQYHYVGSGITTKCNFPSDFDVRIDYSLSTWPPANGATISLSTQHGYTFVEQVQRMTASWGDGYGAYPKGTTVTPLPDQSGTLRLSRSHGIIRASFYHGSHWVYVGQKRFSDSVFVSVGIHADSSVWQGQTVSAAIDNFTITARKPDCPVTS